MSLWHFNNRYIMNSPTHMIKIYIFIDILLLSKDYLIYFYIYAVEKNTIKNNNIIYIYTLIFIILVKYIFLQITQKSSRSTYFYFIHMSSFQIMIRHKHRHRKHLRHKLRRHKVSIIVNYTQRKNSKISLNFWLNEY